MRRSLTIAFVVVASLLAVSAQPVAAVNVSGSLEVGSIHTTDADFNSAQTLTNLSVSGSGDSADVVLEGGELYNPVDSEGDGATNNNRIFLGDDSANNVYSSEVRIEPTKSGTITTISPDISTTFGSDYGLTVDVYIVAEAPDETFGEGTLVKSNWNPDWTTGKQQIDINDFDVASGTTYTIEFVSSGTDSAGDSDYLMLGLDDSASSTWFTQSVYGTQNEYGDVDVDISSTPATGTYISTNQTVGNADEVFVNLTLSSADATITAQEYSGGSWSDVNSTTVSTTANHTLIINPSSSTLRTKVEFAKTGSNPTAELHDEGVLFDSRAPSVDNFSASPSGGSDLSSSTTTFSIDVSDPDFGTPQGDSVTVDLYIDGQQTNSTTITSNQTVSFAESVSGGGSHDWYVETTDSYGDTATSDTFDFDVPSQLTIYNESNPTQVLNNTSVELRFYLDDGSTQIIERTANNGTVDLIGLPVGESFVVVAQSEGYLFRRIFVPSIYETQSIYLLPENETHVDVIFDHQDFTGRFPQQDSVLLVQRGLNGTWKTVQGDFFGATGEFSAQLAYNQRHRLVLMNVETGEQKVLGSYTPISSGTETVKITTEGEIEVNRIGPRIQFSPTVRTLTASNSSSVTVDVSSHNDSLSTWNVSVILDEPSGQTVLSTTNRTDPSGGTVSPTFNLSGKAGSTVSVVVDWTVATGESGQRTATYRIQERFVNQYSLLNIAQSATSLIPSANVGAFTTFVSLIVTVFVTTAVAATFRVSSEMVGLVAVGTLAAFSVIGWVGYSIVFVGGVALVAFSAVRSGL